VASETACPKAIPRLGGHVCAAIFLLALAVRLAATASLGFASLHFGDSRAYLSAARELARTGHYPVTTDPYYFRAPGYPFFLVLVTLGRPDRIALAKVGSAATASLAAPFLAALSARIFRRRALALATGLAAAVHPSFVLQSSDIQSEALFLPLLLAAAFLLLAAADRPSSNLAVLAGGFLGLAALTRPTTLLLAPLLVAPLGDRRYPRRARAHLAASALLGLALCVAPWLLRNAIVFRTFVPISDSFGAAFYDGNSQWASRFYDVKSRTEYDAWVNAMETDRQRRFAAIDPRILSRPRDRSRFFVKMAWEDLERDPRQTLRLYEHKALQWLRPYPTSWYWPKWIVIVTGVYYLGLEAAALLGLVRSPRPSVSRFCAGVLILSTLGHLLVVPLWRYRVPYWDPILLMFGLFGLQTVLTRAAIPVAPPDPLLERDTLIQ
jgi:4-amino-4-deoxy-L-arabinose transferase-like glycosyltransferase